MQTDLFGMQDRHEAGGSVKTALPPGVRGDAEFCGPKDCYRPILRRWLGEEFPDRFALFIGMNPSTAEAHVDDRTIYRDWQFTRREGLFGFVKCNVADYRATYPSDFLKLTLPAASDRNLTTIRDAAARAAIIIVCHGNLVKPLQPLGKQVIEALRRDGRCMLCFGTNKNGSPKHTLYTDGATPLIEFA